MLLAELYDLLDRTNSTNDKVAAIVTYLEDAPARTRPGRSTSCPGAAPAPVRCADDGVGLRLNGSTVRPSTSATRRSGTAPRRSRCCWRLHPTAAWLRRGPPLHEAVAFVRGLRGLEAEGSARRYGALVRLHLRELFVLNKLITGGFRVGVSKRLLVRALAQWSGVDKAVLFHRMMGAPVDSEARFLALFDEDQRDADLARPYPFFLASPLEGEPGGLGDIGEWQAEWKWDGIRGQLIARGAAALGREGKSRDDAFPDSAQAEQLTAPRWTGRSGVAGRAAAAVREPAAAPGARRQEDASDFPRVLCYDALEAGGEDVRERPLRERALLEELAGAAGLPVRRVTAATWTELANIRGESRARASKA